MRWPVCRRVREWKQGKRHKSSSISDQRLDPHTQCHPTFVHTLLQITKNKLGYIGNRKHLLCTHLKPLGADLLPFLHPCDARLWLSCCLAYKRGHTSRNPNLIFWSFHEPWFIYKANTWSDEMQGRCHLPLLPIWESICVHKEIYGPVKGKLRKNISQMQVIVWYSIYSPSGTENSLTIKPINC